MTACEHIRYDIGGYVLGALEPAEAAAVREHLASCADCAGEHARLAGLPALLDLAGQLEDAPGPAPAVEERVLDAVARERGRPARHRRFRLPSLNPRVLVPAGLAAVALVVAVIALTGGEDAATGYQVQLRPVPGSSARGSAALASVSGGTSLKLAIEGLPPDPDTVYEVECDGPKGTDSAGTFRADAKGHAYVDLTTAARRGEYDAIRVVRRHAQREYDVMTATLN
jgi:Putative zinc-finger